MNGINSQEVKDEHLLMSGDCLCCSSKMLFCAWEWVLGCFSAAEAEGVKKERNMRQLPMVAGRPEEPLGDQMICNLLLFGFIYKFF